MNRRDFLESSSLCLVGFLPASITERVAEKMDDIGYRQLRIHDIGKRLLQAGVIIKGHEQEPVAALGRLLTNPNEQDTFGDLLYRWHKQLEQTGTALTWMAPGLLGGRPSELRVLPTNRTFPAPATRNYPQGAYVIRWSEMAKEATVSAEWVMVMQKQHPILEVVAPTELLKKSALIELHAQSYCKLFSRSITTSLAPKFGPGIVVTVTLENT